MDEYLPSQLRDLAVSPIILSTGLTAARCKQMLSGSVLPCVMCDLEIEPFVRAEVIAVTDQDIVSLYLAHDGCMVSQLIQREDFLQVAPNSPSATESRLFVFPVADDRSGPTILVDYATPRLRVQPQSGDLVDMNQSAFFGAGFSPLPGAATPHAPLNLRVTLTIAQGVPRRSVLLTLTNHLNGSQGPALLQADISGAPNVVEAARATGSLTICVSSGHGVDAYEAFEARSPSLAWATIPVLITNLD